jgi:hypothetical protein
MVNGQGVAAAAPDDASHSGGHHASRGADTNRPAGAAGTGRRAVKQGDHSLTAARPAAAKPTPARSPNAPTRAPARVNRSTAKGVVALAPTAATAAAATTALPVATETSSVHLPGTTPPVTLKSIVTDMLSWVGLGQLTNPNPFPDVPLGPIFGAIWGAVREIESVFNNRRPTVKPVVTSGQDIETGAITGNLGAFDLDGDALTVTASVDPADGRVSVDAQGNFTYTPSATVKASGGEVKLTVTADDGAGHIHGVGELLGQGGHVSVTITLHVTAVNVDAPVANADTANTNEDTPVFINVLDNDADTRNIGLVLTAVGGASHGTVTISSGQALYTPSGNYNGGDTFTYTVSDGSKTATATVTVTVAPVNDAPVIGSTPFTIDNVTTNGVVTGHVNVTDVDSGLTYQLGTTDGTGPVVVTGNTFVYTPTDAVRENAYTTPEADTASFTIVASDGEAPAVTVNVAAPITPRDPHSTNEAPVAGETTVQFDEDSGVTYGTVRAIDPEGTAVVYRLPGGNQLTQGVVLIDPATGAWAFKPTSQAQFESYIADGGTTVTFTIDATDGDLSTPITVTAPVLPAVLPDYIRNAGSSPIGLAIGNDGTLYVSNGQYVNVIGPSGLVTDPILVSEHGVRSIAVGGNHIYVTDGTTGVISVIDPASDYTVSPFATIAGSAGALTVDTNGNVYVISTDSLRGSNSLIVLSPTANTVNTIALGGEPSDVAVGTDGYIYLTFYDGITGPGSDPDVDHGTIQVLTATGAVESTFEVGGDPFGLTVNTDGVVLVTDSTYGIVTMLGPGGSVLRSIPLSGKPAGIVLGPNGQIFVSDYEANSVVVLPANTTFYDIGWTSNENAVTTGYLNPFGPGLAGVVSYSSNTIDPALGTLDLNSETGEWTFTPTTQARANAGATADEADDFVTIEFTATVGTQYSTTVSVSVSLSPTTVDGNPNAGVSAHAVALDANDDPYVIGYDPATQHNVLARLNPDHTYTTLAVLNGSPQNVVIGGDGRFYVTDSLTGAVLVIDPDDGYSVSTFATVPGAIAMAVDREGSFYVTSVVARPDDGTYIGELRVLNTAGETVGSPIDLGGLPGGVTIDDDGHVYVTTVDPLGDGGYLTVLNPGSLAVEKRIALPGVPTSVTVVGGMAYITPNDGANLLAVDLSTGIVSSLAVTDQLLAVGVSDEGHLYAVRGDGTVTRIDPSDANSAAVLTTNEDSPLVIELPGIDGQVVTWGATHGTSVYEDDVLTYTPDVDYYGYDTVNYAIADADGTILTRAVVHISVTSVNDAPVTDPSEATVAAGKTLTIAQSALLEHVFDVEADPLTISGILPASHGVAAISDTGAIIYTPEAGYTGYDTFAVIVSDGNGGTTNATIDVHVIAPPVAVNDTLITDEDTPLTIAPNLLLGNDSSSAGGGALTITAVSDRAHLNDDGTITYTPAPDADDDGSFSYSITDALGGTTTAQVSVTINPVNDAPKADPAKPFTIDSVDEYGRVAGHVNVTDPDGTVTYTLASGVVQGVVTVSADGTFTYTPTVDARETAWSTTGLDSAAFSIIASDGVNQTVVNVIAPITPRDPASPNQAPVVAQEQPVHFDNESNVTYGVVSAFDPDGSTVTYSLVGPNQLAQGIVLINPVTGAWAFKPTDEAQFDAYQTAGGASVTFTINATDGDLTTPVTVTAPIIPNADFSQPGSTIDNAGDWPLGIAVDGGGKVYVANGDGYLNIVNPDGSPATDPIDFGGHYLFGVALHDGLIFVADWNDGQVKVVDPRDGYSVHTFAEVPKATGLAFAGDGRLYVTTDNLDGTGSMNIVSADGSTILRTIALDSSSYGVTVGADGRVYATLYDTGAVDVFTSDGSWLKRLAFSGSKPLGIAIDSTGLLVISDDTSGRVTVADPDQPGRYFSSYYGGAYASGVTIGAAGQIYVADVGTGAVRTAVAMPAENILGMWANDVFMDDADEDTGVQAGHLNPFGPGLGDVVSYSATVTNPQIGTIDLDPVTGQWTLTPTPLGLANAGFGHWWHSESGWNDSITVNFTYSVANQFSTTFTLAISINSADTRFRPRLAAIPISIPGIQPRAIALGAGGRLYVLGGHTYTRTAGLDDPNTSSLAVLNPDGTIATIVSLPGNALGMTVGPDGRIYVDNFDAGTVSVLDPDNGYAAQLIASVAHPVGLTVRDGLLYVTSSNTGANSSTTTLNIIDLDNPAGNRAIPLQLPSGLSGSIAVGSDGHIYVATNGDNDTTNGTLTVLTTGGAIVKTIDLGAPTAWAITVDDSVGIVYATDGANFRVIDPNTGAVVSTTIGTGGASTGLAGGIALGADGTVYIPNRNDNTVAVLNPPATDDGGIVGDDSGITVISVHGDDDFGTPTGIAAAPYEGGYTLITNSDGSLTVLDPSQGVTSTGSLAGHYDDITSIAYGPDGGWYFIDGTNDLHRLENPGLDDNADPSTSIAYPATYVDSVPLHGAVALASDSDGNLYVVTASNDQNDGSEDPPTNSLIVFRGTDFHTARVIALGDIIPTDLAVAGDGHIYITTDDGKLVTIDTDFETNFHTDTVDLGLGPGSLLAYVRAANAQSGLPAAAEFDRHSLAVGPTGVIYVTDPASSRIIAIDPDGTMRAISLANIPFDISVGYDGHIYVTNPLDHAITVVAGDAAAGWSPFVPATNSQSAITVEGLRQIAGVAMASNGRTYVVGVSSDTGHAVLTDVSGGTTNQIDLGSFMPLGVVAGSDGLVYVTDNTSGRVLAYDPANGSLQTIASIANAAGLAIDHDGNLYITTAGDGSDASTTHGTLNILDRQGHAIRSPVDLGGASAGVAIGPDGRIYVTTIEGGLKIFNPDGSPNGTSIELPDGVLAAGIAVGPDGTAYVADLNGADALAGNVIVVGPTGTITRRSAGVDTAFGITIGDDGSIYATSLGGNTIAVLSSVTVPRGPDAPSPSAPIIFTSSTTPQPGAHGTAAVSGRVYALFPSTTGGPLDGSWVGATTYVLASPIDSQIGQISISPDGTWTFTPTIDARLHAGDVFGQMESVAFTILASNGDDSVTITVVAPISPETKPQVANPSYTLDTSGYYAVGAWGGGGKANFYDIDGDGLSYTAQLDPAVGSVYISSDGHFTVYVSAQARYNAWFTPGEDTALITVNATDGLFSAATTVSVPIVPLAPNVGSTLAAGRTMQSNFFMQSANGRYRLWMQGDGNLVLYDEQQTHKAIWATNKFGPNTQVSMQSDGNLVVYSGSNAIWASGTNGKTGAKLVLQDDGNLVVYQGSTVVWDRINGIPRPPAPKPAPVTTSGGVAGTPPRSSGSTTPQVKENIGTSIKALAEKVQQLYGRSGSDSVQIERVKGNDGTNRLIVYITGQDKTWESFGDSVEVRLNGFESTVGAKISAAYFDSNYPRPTEVMLVGHSKGGMIAQLLAADDYYRETFNITAVVTFGSPRVTPVFNTSGIFYRSVYLQNGLDPVTNFVWGNVTLMNPNSKEYLSNTNDGCGLSAFCYHEMGTYIKIASEFDKKYSYSEIRNFSGTLVKRYSPVKYFKG